MINLIFLNYNILTKLSNIFIIRFGEQVYFIKNKNRFK